MLALDTQPMRPRTHAIFLIDESGSMGSHKATALRATNAQLATFRLAHETQDLTVSMIPIDSTFRGYRFKDVPSYKLVDLDRYHVGGSTPIVDCLNAGLDDIEGRMMSDPDLSCLVMLVTDGENNINSAGLKPLSDRIRRLLATDRYTFAFSVPRGYARATERTFGIPAGCIQEWEQTERGFETMAYEQGAATQTYFTARSKGIRSSRMFYATTDITPEMSEKIEVMPTIDLSGVKEYLVPTKMEIKDFFANVVGRPFQQGKLFYELMKREEVQPQKELIIQDRTDPKVLHAGVQARTILGLPVGNYVKVTPGVHGKWRIFVQSTSNNRKLVGGTAALVL